MSALFFPIGEPVGGEAIRQRAIAEGCGRGIERNRKELERLGAALTMPANCLERTRERAETGCSQTPTKQREKC